MSMKRTFAAVEEDVGQLSSKPFLYVKENLADNNVSRDLRLG